MTTGKMIMMLRDLERDLDAIAHSDCAMGTFDIEHLESARGIVSELLEGLMASKWRLRREVNG